MHMRKTGALICALIIIAVGAVSAEKITVMNNRSDIMPTVWKQIGDSFTKATGIQVEFQSMPDINVVKQRIAANNLPDVFMMTTEQIPENQFAKYLEPLDGIAVVKDKLLIDGVSYTYQGKTWAIGQTKSLNGVTYNKNVLAKAGVTSWPKDMNEFMTMLDKIQKAGVTPFTIIPSAGWSLTAISPIAEQYSMIAGGNVNYKNDMPKVDDPCAMDKPLGKAAYLLYQIASKGYMGDDPMSLSWDNSKREIAQGNIAMTPLGSWLPPQIVDNGAKAGDIMLMPLPIVDSKGFINSTAGYDWHFAVWKGSAQKAAALKFLDYFLGNKELYTLWMNNFGQTSIRKDMKDTAPALSGLAALKLVLKEEPTNSVEYNAIRDKAQFDDQAVAGAAIAATNDKEFKAAMDDFNARWAAARKAVAK